MDLILPSAQQFGVILCLSLLGVIAGRQVTLRSAPGCHISRKECLFEYKYYQEGDVMIGGLFTVNTGIKEFYYGKIRYVPFYCICAYIDHTEYRNLLAFIFAVDEINQNPDILPNITLGYHVYDICGNVRKSLQNLVQILSGKTGEFPNYSCRGGNKFAGLIGNLRTATTPVAQILRLYGYPQISYGTSDTLLSDRTLFPNYFQLFQGDQIQYTAILKLLKHYGWNWVGIIVSNDDIGERELQELSQVITSHGICIEVIIKMSDTMEGIYKDLAIIEKSTSQVLIACGTCAIHCVMIFQKSIRVFDNTTLILKASWSYVLHFTLQTVMPFNGSLSFAPSNRLIPGMQTFLHNVHPSNRPSDPILEDIWIMGFQCLISNDVKNAMFQFIYNLTVNNCTGKKHISDLGERTNYAASYSVYTAVYVLAHALHNMLFSSTTEYRKMNRGAKEYKNKLHDYVRRVRYTDKTGRGIFFNERREIPTTYYLESLNFTIDKNKCILTKHVVGVFDNSRSETNLFIRFEKILWKKGKIPWARCNDFCPPGYRKAPGYNTCCYRCVPCSEGEMSNVTDSDNCLRCPDNEYPDEDKVKCILKPYEFLSYKDDIIVPIFFSISVFFLILTLFILGIFILYWDTPVVRANNRNLSFLLLVSIVLSFLCVFLFLANPVDITCMLRQTAFGVTFSVAVSSLLAKTIMVCIAFKATKPGSTWRKWVGAKVSNFVVLICSSVQILINVIWLSTCPPFQEFDTQTYQGKIIVQCNEGSVIAFYCVLGYMGLLAAVSFIIAFLARTLPDSFNEAKYITFSMLVFCSVWIAMIPAYLSTKGKYMVAVEIFAILASTAGLLSFMFFPKCYILLKKTKTNNRRHLLQKRNQ